MKAGSMLTPKVTCHVIGTCHPANERRVGRRLRMNTSTDKRLVHEAVDAYVEWREECVAVWSAEIAQRLPTDA
jgi:hypothetical protein